MEIHSRIDWRHEGGISLIEVMVTVIVMLVVLAGSFRALEDARRATEVTALVADGNQNLRVAVVQITRDVMQTGRELPNAGIPVPTGAGATA
ncbi:MAG: prepilin-type N-terminal cleavage/methylation domain-containing protein, partial [Acidobacteria bacterium]|nr:prepilin-type N-terminal cleavage/methylation domain-containing protein [Acidobacteriota bacterium]